MVLHAAVVPSHLPLPSGNTGRCRELPGPLVKGHGCCARARRALAEQKGDTWGVGWLSRGSRRRGRPVSRGWRGAAASEAGSLRPPCRAGGDGPEWGRQCRLGGRLLRV